MTQWLRWWHGSATDPKWRTVARKACQPIPSVLAVWALILENASENATERGRTHEWDNDVAGDALGIEPAAVEAILDAMQGLVLDGDRLKGWEKRQPKREDSSAERAKAWRERKRTQRDAPEQSRTDTEQNTVANATDRPLADLDPPIIKDAVWQAGLAYLASVVPKSEAQLRRVLGKWCGEFGEALVWQGLAQAQQHKPVEVISWIEGWMRQRRPRDGPEEHPNNRLLREMGCGSESRDDQTERDFANVAQLRGPTAGS